jgi:hypothetical protein
LILNLSVKSWTQNNDYFTQSSDTVVVITLNSYKEIRGVLINQNDKIINLEVANKEKVIYKEDIKFIKYISRDEIKNIKEFENTNPIFSKYCYLPSAYLTKEKTVSTNSHYFLTSNSKIGINENFEFSVGNVFFVNLFSSVSYSKEIGNNFQGALSVIGHFNWANSQLNLNNRLGWGIIPRITFGDDYKNTTVGITTYQFPENGIIPSTIVYGGYFGSQKKIAEKFTIAGETLGLTIDGFQYLLITNIIVNFRRNSRENWSAGITLLNTNSIDLQSVIGSNSGSVLPLPYIGLQRDF